MEHLTHKKINGVDPQLLSLMNQSPKMTCIRCGPLRCSGAKQTGTEDAGMWPSLNGQCNQQPSSSSSRRAEDNSQPQRMRYYVSEIIYNSWTVLRKGSTCW